VFAKVGVELGFQRKILLSTEDGENKTASQINDTVFRCLDKQKVGII
jgi:hypothetical protein